MASESVRAGWQASPLGQHFLGCERHALVPKLAKLGGETAAQVGTWGGPNGLLDVTNMQRRWMVGDGADDQPAPSCLPERIDLLTDTADLVLLPHVLERANEPHLVLREAHRVLKGEGHVVVCGFNPWSTWGLPGLVGVGNFPWSDRFLGEARVRDWLKLLDFEIVDAAHYFFRPPINNEKFLARTEFIERVAARWLPIPPSAYALVARKKIVGMNPLAVQFKKREVLPNGITAPTARVLH